MKWLVNALAVLVLSALRLSQLPLFRGVADDLRSAGGVGGKGRGRAHSGEKDIGVGKKIKMMLECKKPVDMWKLQTSMRGMLESEKVQWEVTGAEKTPGSLTGLVCAVLGAVLGGIVLSCLIIGLTLLLSISEELLNVLVVLVVCVCVGMEVY